MSSVSVFRRQMRTPFFALSITLLIAVVVATNATAFGAIHALRWKALPYAAGERLVELRTTMQKLGFTFRLSEPLRRRVAEDHTHFSGAAGFINTLPRGDASGRDWRLARVTPGFEHVLGIMPALGRSFAEDDAHEGADAVLVLSDMAWRSRFDADPNVIGREVRFADRPFKVIGVMPSGFVFPDSTIDAWYPYAPSAAEQELFESGKSFDLGVVARLAPAITIEQAREVLATIFASQNNLVSTNQRAGLVANVRAWRERFSGGYDYALTLLQLAALILLLVVAANLASLNIERVLARRRELDIRRALGAGERAIVNTIAADLVPPALLGLALGLALTPLGRSLLRSHGLMPQGLPPSSTFDLAALSAGVVVSVLVLGVAMFTALASPANLHSSAHGSASLGRMRPLLLIAQVMLTTALLGSAGLLLRSAFNLTSVERGFDPRGVLITQVDPIGVRNRGTAFNEETDAPRLKPVVEEIQDAAASLPGVQRVAVASAPPFVGADTRITVPVDGEDEKQTMRKNAVGPGYFDALGSGFLLGRDFDRDDNGDASPVIVDELYVQRFLHGIDPLTASVSLPITAVTFRRARIIAVVRTFKHAQLDETPNLSTVYTFDSAPLPFFYLVTRTRGDPAALAETLRQRLHARLPGAEFGINKPLQDLVEDTLLDRRSLLQALGGFAVITLLLAALGLAAVLGFAVRRRLPEFGVRMALGAKASRIVRLVMRQGGALIALGTVLGLVLGIPLARLLSDRLFGIAFSDPQTWGAAALIVSIVAAFACWLPAWRAASVDPTTALRHE
jgi:putative ABC transport system permease protein